MIYLPLRISFCDRWSIPHHWGVLLLRPLSFLVEYHAATLSPSWWHDICSRIRQKCNELQSQLYESCNYKKEFLVKHAIFYLKELQRHLHFLQRSPCCYYARIWSKFTWTLASIVLMKAVILEKAKSKVNPPFWIFGRAKSGTSSLQTRPSVHALPCNVSSRIIKTTYGKTFNILICWSKSK